MKLLVIASFVIVAATGLASQSAPANGAANRETKNPQSTDNKKPSVEMDKASMERLHKGHVDTFIAEDGVGIMRVETMPRPRVFAKDSTGQTYRVERFDLIGLNPSKEPTVFLASTRGHEMTTKHAHTRMPDDFENAVITDFAKTEVSWKISDDKSIRMVGALRATSDCLDCHKVKEGDIMGAFTYKLVPGGLTTAEKEMNRLVELLDKREAKNAGQK